MRPAQQRLLLLLSWTKPNWSKPNWRKEKLSVSMPSPTPSTQVRKDVWLYFSRVSSILGQFAIADENVQSESKNKSKSSSFLILHWDSAGSWFSNWSICSEGDLRLNSQPASQKKDLGSNRLLEMRRAWRHHVTHKQHDCIWHGEEKLEFQDLHKHPFWIFWPIMQKLNFLSILSKNTAVIVYEMGVW